MGNATRDTVVHLRARDILRESGRTLWYLRAILAGLLVLFVLLTLAMYYMGAPVETVKRTPSPMAETVYFCAITALTIGYGDVVPTSTFGRIDAVLLGVVGMVFTGLIVAAAVRGVQEAARRASHES
ncbi:MULTISPECIES: potassium channel family protein [unclassified Caballeronia]|uniref:potassium channel family protein n=1 Tax=unclassified Caballeronia TaxID=2646786 RepID=UPI002858F9CE|nr:MULTISPECIES: potassium channel family protein [unclassified Caballeronia]MDR5749729.1 potassium channel family protein [Caballeronia sp. LZ024]MDR5843142.1 potassium channel family protein [Caballeronia sp. LZ031]